MRSDFSLSRITIVALCFLLVFSIVGAGVSPVAAQSNENETGGDGDGNIDVSVNDGVTGGDMSDAGEGDPNESGGANESGDPNESGAGTGTGSSDGVGGFGPSPGEWAIQLIEELFDDYVVSNIEDGIDHFHEEGVGSPAPGEYEDRSTWTTDISQPVSEWGSDMEGYFSGATIAHYTTGLAGLVWLLIQLVNSGFADATERREQRKRIGIAFGMILTGPHLSAPFILHAINEAALQFAPEGAEFTGSIGNLARLGIGVIFGAILLLVSSFAFVIGILSIELVDFLVIAIYSMWGLMWAGWASRGQARSFGYQGIFTLGGVGVMKIIQSVILLTIFNISWTSSFFSPLQVLVGTTVGLAVAFILVPYAFLQHTIKAAATYLGAGAALASSQIDTKLDQHVFDRGDQYDEETKSSNMNDTSYDRPSDHSRSSSGPSGRGREAVADGGSPESGTGSGSGSSPSDLSGDSDVRDQYDRGSDAERINHQYD